MPRYFFDILDGDRQVPDPDGVELADLNAAEVEATQTMAEIALELLPGTRRKRLRIEVREGSAVRLVLRLRFDFSVR